MGKGVGYAKSILFGEHFVVYGVPAIGLGLSKKIEAEVVKATHTKIESAHVDANLFSGLEAVKSSIGVTDNFAVKVKSEIPIGSGLGSSAAITVAMARAISEECKLNLSDSQISAAAFNAEKVYHGNPSGIDNTLATYGGAIVFQRKPEGNQVSRLKVGKPLFLVAGNTGKKKKPTAEIVAEVKARKERFPGLFDQLIKAEEGIISLAIAAIEQGRLEEVGELMNFNHGLLSSIGVSSKENEDIVQAARSLGALGAKITGAGMGGSCIILARNEKNSEEIENEIKRMGYLAITATVQ